GLAESEGGVCSCQDVVFAIQGWGWIWRPAGMARPYSMDLRERAVWAVEREGLSRRAAAARFGLGVSTVINWVRRVRETGSVRPGRMGGHKPKKIAGAYRVWLLARCRERDFTLRGLVAELGERGLRVDYRSVWEFVHAAQLGAARPPPAGQRPVRALEHDDLSGRAAARPHRGAVAHRWADQRPMVSDLYRTGSRACPQPRRSGDHGQSRLAQGQGGAPRPSPGRRQAPLPAEILARPQPDRAALRQAK